MEVLPFVAKDQKIRPERVDRFIMHPEGVIIEKPDGRKYKLEKDSDGDYKPVEISKRE